MNEQIQNSSKISLEIGFKEFHFVCYYLSHNILFREDFSRPGDYYIGGQVKDKYGEFNHTTVVLKTMKLTANNQGELWKKPTTLNIYVKEYEVFKILSTSESELSHTLKRKFLCESDYYFYEDLGNIS